MRYNYEHGIKIPRQVLDFLYTITRRLINNPSIVSHAFDLTPFSLRCQPA